ncbi:MAG: neutral zinc metallopeptidase [Parvibaculaceae bacterium]
MRLGDERPSDNIEDRRGSGGMGFPGGRGGFRVPVGGRGGMSIGGLVLLLGVAWLLGINPLDILTGGGNMQVPNQQAPGPTQSSAGDDELKDFTARVLGSTERTWQKVFSENGRQYQDPQLVLFEQHVQSACGMAQSAMGPFYCPRDSKVYIDLSFYREMKQKLGATGDFAQAYVIAHEVGHHIQNQLGIADKVTEERMRSSPEVANALSVRMELQADCFAGVWAKRADDANRILEQGDIEEGLNAAAAIGDDRLQKRSQGYVVPESFTHGTSAQRVRWLKRGLEKGDIGNCDSFGTDQL